MSAGWWGVVAVVVLGTALVVYGWAHDRRRVRAALAKAKQPTRSIPGVPEHTVPAYVTEDELTGPAIDPSVTSGESDLIAHRDAAATLPAGAAEGAFLNRADRGLAVLVRPDVLVLDADLVGDREVTALLSLAKTRGRPLVIVAPDFGDRTLGVLRANVRAGTVRTLPIALADAAARRRAAALTGGRPIDEGDLLSGWLPETAWGRCDGWIADLDDSWVLVEGRSTTAGGRETLD
ncbi:MAG TPA: hypothetical protein PKG79_08910 [Propioniciclava tarda]|nr:hypothetical protein [Propioniciclava tarda]